MKNNDQPKSLLNEKNAQPFFLPGGRHAVLLIHGFTGSPGHMLPLGRALNESGFTVRGIRLKGHGDTVQAMMQATWQDWLGESALAYEELKKEYDFVSVAGLSMGGVLALLIAQMSDPCACVTIAAPMDTISPARKFSLIAAPFMPICKKRNDGSHDGLPKEYDLGYDEIPTRKSHDLNILMARAKKNLSKVTCPLLAIQSRADKTVTKDSPDIILQGASSAVKKKVLLDDAPHVCTLSPEMDKIAGAMTEFLGTAQNPKSD